MTCPLRVEGVVAGYGGGTVALEGVTFEVAPGRTVAVLGPNGGGKTTLFRALLGEAPHRDGTVSCAGRPAYVPQTERARLDFPVTALEVALMGAYARTPWWRRVSRADREAARAALDRMGLGDHAGANFGTLSGGQRQRVLIARALVQDARVVLLDEPYDGVDVTSARRIDAVLDDLRADGRVVLVATHDIEQARSYDLVLCLRGRQVAFGAPATTLSEDVLAATYGDELIRLPGGGVMAVDHHAH